MAGVVATTAIALVAGFTPDVAATTDGRALAVRPGGPADRATSLRPTWQRRVDDTAVVRDAFATEAPGVTAVAAIDPPISFAIPENTAADASDFPGGDTNNEISFPMIATGDMNSDGIADLVPAFFPNCCGANGGVAVMLGLGDGTFAEPTAFQIGGTGANRVMGLGLGDFDEDGDLDVFGTVPQRQEYDVWLNDGSGDLGSPTFTPLTTKPGDDLKVADLDGDGHLDVVAAGSQDGSVSAFYGRGDGTFADALLFTSPNTPVSLVIGDFDGVGSLDIALGGHVQQSFTIATATGSRTYATSTVAIPFLTATHLFAADLDGDADIDLGLGGFAATQAPLGFQCYSCITTVKGNGHGTFVVPPATDLGAYATAPDNLFGDNTGQAWGPNSPDPVDIDGDADIDLVFAYPDTNGLVLVARNDATGKFDLDTYVGIADNSGTRVGSFQINADFTNGTGQFMRGIALDDFDEDGAIDLAVAGEDGGAFTANRGAIAIVRGVTDVPGEFAAPKVSAVPGRNSLIRSGIAFADWDGDNDDDVIAMRFNDNHALLFEYDNGEYADAVDIQSSLRGTFACHRTTSEQLLESGDFDGDGNDDVLCRGANAAGEYALNVWFGDGANGADLVTIATYTGAFSMPALQSADIDGDGDLDILDSRVTGCGPCQMSTVRYRNNGDRTFDELPTITHGPIDQFQTPIAVIDVDNDLDLDLVSRPGSGTNPPLQVRRNNGTGAFGDPTTSQPVVLANRNLAVHTIIAGDLDEDGNQDLVIEKSWDYQSNIGVIWPGGLFVMLGNGDGTFDDPVQYTWGGGGSANDRLVDMDLDGHLDLPINATHWGVEVLRGVGDGTFDPVQRYWTGTAWNFAMRTRDLDGDARPEIVKFRHDAFALTVLHNTSSGEVAGADLSVTAIDAPASATPGDSATITATVANTGSRATGRWTDQLWLSADDQWGLDDRLLGSVEHAGLAGGSSYDVAFGVQFSPLLDGDHRLIVRVDARGQLDETDESNNTELAPNPVTLDIAELAVGTPLDLTLGETDVRYLRIADPGTQLEFSFDAASGDVADVDVVRGRVPVPVRDLVLGDIQAVHRVMALPDEGSGDWFVRLGGRPGAGAATTVTLGANPLDFGLFRIAPNRGGNSGTATVLIDGLGFGRASRVRLIDGPAGATSGTSSAAPIGDGQISVTLDLRGVPVGRYDVEATRVDGAVAVLGDAFTVTAGSPGHLEMYTMAPPRMRSGWTGEYVVTVFNTGDTDLTADALVVNARGASMRLPNRTSFSTRPIVFLPTDPPGPDGAVPAGVFPPGAARRVVVEFLATGSPRLTVELYEPDDVVPTAEPPTGLVIDRVSGPAAATSGGIATVSFRIRNTGAARLAGPWTLDVGLLAEGASLEGNVVAVPVPSVPVETTVGLGAVLDPGESLNLLARVAVGDVADGDHRWLVGWPKAPSGVVEQLDDFFTSIDLVDDEPDAVSWSTGVVAARARGIAVDAVQRFSLLAGETRLLRIDAGTGPARVAIEVEGAVPLDVIAAAGAVPFGGAVDAEATVMPGAPGELDLVTSPGDDYLVVGPPKGSGATVELLVTTPAAALDEVTPESAGNGGDATIEIEGAGFDTIDGVALVAADDTRTPATSWSVLDSFNGSATFDLRALVPGAYTVELTRPGDDPLSAPFTVLAGGAGTLAVDIEPPERMRFDVPNPVTVHYSNTGTVDIPLPLLTVSAREGGEIGVVTDRVDADNETTFIPPSPLRGSSVLPPQSSGAITLWYTPPADASDDVTFDLWADDFADPALAGEPMDWAAIGAASKPAGADDAAWAAHLAEERARYGETYGDLSGYVAGEYEELASVGLDRAVFADGEWLFFAQSSGRPGVFRSGGIHRHTATAVPSAVPVVVPRGRPRQVAEGDGIQNVRAIVIGNPDGTLPGASADARQISGLLTKTYNIPKASVKLLDGAAATPEATRTAIANAKQSLDADDLLIVTVSTHGIVDANDIGSSTKSLNVFAGGNMTGADWNTTLSDSPSKVLFVLDTCNSANITQHVTAPNVTALASSDWAQSVPDASYSEVLVNELQKDPRGDFYAAAQRAADIQLKRGYGDGTPSAGGLDFIANWRHSSIDRPTNWGADGLRAALTQVTEHGFDRRQLHEKGKFGGEAYRPLYPTLDRHGNTTLSINPPDPKKAATAGGGDKQKQAPPKKTRKTKVDGDRPAKVPSDKPGKEGEPEDPPPTRGGPDKTETDDIPVIQSADPNEIVGPTGAGRARWVAGEQTLAYEVRFENLGPGSVVVPPGQSIATAPATLVDITTTLDADIDIATFSLGDFGAGNGDESSGYPTVRFSPPAGAQGWSEDVLISVPVYGTADPPVGLVLRGEASLDPATREVRWTITALDPATGAPPADPLVGFLPPEDGTHAGQGFARYHARSNSAGVEIAAQASIVFDANDSIETNVWTNSIDLDRPTARATRLAGTSRPRFTVAWSGTDSGSGAATFDVFASVDGGPLGLWLDDTRRTSTAYIGEVGHRYSFAVSTIDEVGHEGSVPTQPQTTTRVVRDSGQTSHSIASVLLGADGAVYPIAGARTFGSLRGRPVRSTPVAIDRTPSGKGYIIAMANGAVYAFGDAKHRGSMVGVHLRGPVVDVEITPSGNGYLLFAADGGVFRFGDARFYGSMARHRLRGRIVAGSITPSGNGYVMVGANGSVYHFGDARWYGSVARRVPRVRIVDIALSPTGKGYLLVSAAGKVFAFGDAKFRGSAHGRGPTRVVGISMVDGGNAYAIAREGGKVWIFTNSGRSPKVRRALPPFTAPITGIS